MTIYFYAKTDNRLGLDRLRRTAALARELQKEYEVYFMTTEFRSATYAKRVLGIEKAVGIEDFRNIGTVCERGDVIIYDSDEHNETIHQEMIDYFGKFFRISYDPKDMPKEGEILISPHIVGTDVINAVLVDSHYFEAASKELRLFFYGDSDYERRMLDIAPKFARFDLDLLEGFYFFVDMEEKLNDFFNNIYESEEYPDLVPQASLFITHSPQAALEAAAGGAKVIYFGTDEEYAPLFDRINVRNIGVFDPSRLQEALLASTSAATEYLQKLGVEQCAAQIIQRMKSGA